MRERTPITSDRSEAEEEGSVSNFALMRPIPVDEFRPENCITRFGV